jgi:hypothetical protein
MGRALHGSVGRGRVIMSLVLVLITLGGRGSPDQQERADECGSHFVFSAHKRYSNIGGCGG